MRKSEINKVSKVQTEGIIICIDILIIGIGIVIDACRCVLFEIDQEQLNGICNTIVGIQATVFSIVFSLLSLFSGFQNKEKYGIPVLRYLMKYRHRFLSQYNILLIEVCLLVLSSVLLFLGHTNTLACCFLVSLVLIWFLASEVFMLYSLEDIDEEIFTFLKANLHNKQLKLFDDYVAAEERHIAMNDHPCESRVWELWLYEIEEYSDALGNEDYLKLHDVFVFLVLKYLEDSNKSVQQYGIDCALKVLDSYYSHRKQEQEKDKWGNLKNDISTILANEAFREWMNALADVVYTEKSKCRVDEIVSTVHKFEKDYTIYSKQTIINNFFDVLISKAENNDHGGFILTDFLDSILIRLINGADSCLYRKQCLSYAIHLSLLIIERGYPQIVEEELFDNNYYRFEKAEYKIYFGVVICFLYYITTSAKVIHRS